MEGGCRSDIHFDKYPEIYAHHRSLKKPVRYIGPLKHDNMFDFLQRMLHHSTYLGTVERADNFIASNQLTALTTFDLSHNSPSANLKNFTKVTLQYANRYPNDHIQFGFTTNSYMSQYYDLIEGKIQLRNSLAPLELSYISLNISLDNISNKLAGFSENAVIKKVTTRAGKSNSLQQIVENGPTLILFEPSHRKEFYRSQLMQKIALQYYTCENSNKNTNFKHKTVFDYLQLKNNGQSCQCLKSNIFFVQERCYICRSPNDLNLKCDCHVAMKQFNTLSKEQRRLIKKSSSTPVQCSSFQVFEKYKCRKYSLCCGITPGLSSPNEVQIVQYLMNRNSIYSNLFSSNDLPKTLAQIQKYAFKSSVAGLSCLSNKTLSFVSVDSESFTSIAEVLNVSIHVEDGLKYGAVIVDVSKNRHHVLYQPMQNIENFIINYTFGLLPQASRYKTLTKVHHKSRSVGIIELTGDNIDPMVMDSGKDILLFYYSSWCGSCSMLYHILLSFSRLILNVESLNICKIDGHANDVPDAFNVQQFPTIILYLGNRFGHSVVFPEDLEVSRSNLLEFVLRHSSDVTKSSILFNICSSESLRSSIGNISCTKWLNHKKKG